MTTTELQSPTHGRRFRYYDLIMASFVTVLLCSNLIGPGKISELSLPVNFPLLGDSISFGVGNLFFPIGYIFGDILTEVYGYSRARRVIWMGFFALIFATFMSMVILALPTDPGEPFNATLQPALDIVFGNTYRIVIASMIAYWVGDFVNSYVMAKMKILTQGRFLWMRTIGSTMAGQGVDSMIFYPLAFAGIWSADSLIMVIVFNFFFKSGFEALMTPLTYMAVNFLKRKEGIDVYDVGTNFTPFSLKD
ncbi:MAG: queuosine precursor transporter [Porticoccaceae bacterium]|nr:queuosine precursor transporter [Porticoccaceae bacterium]